MQSTRDLGDEATRHMRDPLRRVEDMPAAFEQALRRVLADEELIESFWERGFQELSKHTSNHTSQWVGKRILTALVAAAVTAGIIWLVKTGYLK